MGSQQPVSFRHQALDLARLSSAIYQSATQLDLWQATLQQIADVLHAREAAYMFWDEEHKTTTFLVTSGRLYGAEACALYATHYGALDRSRQVTCAQPVGVAYRDDEFIPPDFIRGSEYYNDFLIPLGGRYCMAARVLGHRNVNAAIGFHRSVSDGTFSDEDLEILQALTPSLQGAAGLQQKLGELTRHGQMLEAAMDHLSYGLLLLDESGHILYSNRLAEDLIHSRKGLTVRRQRLVVDNPAGMSRLEALIIAAASRSAMGGGLQVEGRDPIAPLSIIVSPLRSQHVPSHANAKVLVVISDPANGPTISRDVLMQLFAMTPAEARLALFLSSGSTAEEVADRFGISITTVRSQLRQVLAKTDTKRQADLVRLISRLDLIQLAP